jgi:biopolymer transport protein ExbD
MRVSSTIKRQSSDWVLQFINIVFLLLLYFLINGTIAETQRPDIALPVSLSRTLGNPPHDAIYVDKTGALSFRNKPASVAAIAAQLGKPNTGEVVVVVDKSLQATKLVTLLRQLDAAGLEQLLLITINRPAP